MIASLDPSDPRELHPAMLMRRIDHIRTASYLELYDWLAPGELLDAPPPEWAEDWAAASPDSLTRQTKGRTE